MIEFGTSVWLKRFGIAVMALTHMLSAMPAGAVELAGSEWRPTRIGNMTISRDADMFVRFEADGKLRGRGGCNNFFGSYKFDDGGLEIGALGATKMACLEPVMEREAAFMKALQSAKSFKRKRIVLGLLDDGGAVVLELAQRGAD
jgi:putative lipoprotein